jgi:ribonuclease HI
MPSGHGQRPLAMPGQIGASDDREPKFLNKNMEEAPKNWTRMRFKRNKVWVATDAEGVPVIEEGRVLVKYQVNQPHQYRVRADNIRPLEAPPVGAVPGPPPETEVAGESPDPICIYTHGASEGNPGPSGIGVLLRYGDRKKEISRFIGKGNRHTAALEAIRAGLAQVRNRNLPARVFTGSGYAYGLLAQGRPMKNHAASVADIRQLMTGFRDLKFVRVRGDTNHGRAVRLAATAIENRE